MTDTESKDSVLLVPDILFRTETVTVKNASPFQTMELVRKDQALITLIIPSGDAPEKPFELIHGKHTRISSDKKSLLAEIDGYPVLSQKTDKEVEILLVEIIPLVSISHDTMQAKITLYPPVRGCPMLNTDLLVEILKENNIRFGLSPDHLETLLARCQGEKILIKDETIACGLLPLDGKDSFLRFAIEVGPFPGKLLGNGKIDFRERKMFVGIAEGETIATRVPATNGTAGLNVSAEEVAQILGIDHPFAVSDGIEYDEKTGIVSASCCGILSMVSETSVKVCEKLIVAGNIDYNTGNIKSQGAVEISGTILPGFKVNTKGDILLNGNVRSGKVKCEGNLTVKGGIIGKKCRVKVKGDADINFIEQGRLRAHGKVIIRKQAYHTRIMADKEIHCEESCQVMAGVIISGESLNLGNVGSANSPSALLAAGVAPGRYLRYLGMREKLHDLEEERLMFLQRYGMKKKIPERESLEQSIERVFENMNKTNLIPGSSANNRSDGIEYLQQISITVQGTIFNGTELQIGNITTILERDLTGVKFSLDRHQKIYTEANSKEEQ